MKILILSLLSLVLFSCKEKEKQLTEEQIVQNIAAPIIAEHVGNFDLLLTKISDTSRSCRDRLRAVDDLRLKYPWYFSEAATYNFFGIKDEKLPTVKKELAEFVCPVVAYRFLDSMMYSPRFAVAVALTRDAIKAACVEEAKGIAYKQKLENDK